MQFRQSFQTLEHPLLQQWMIKKMWCPVKETWAEQCALVSIKQIYLLVQLLLQPMAQLKFLNVIVIVMKSITSFVNEFRVLA